MRQAERSANTSRRLAERVLLRPLLHLGGVRRLPVVLITRFVDIVAAFAKFERDVIIERTTAGMAAARRRGARIGRPRRYVDVERAADLRAAGDTLQAIAAALGVSEGTPRGALKASQGSSPGASGAP